MAKRDIHGLTGKVMPNRKNISREAFSSLDSKRYREEKDKNPPSKDTVDRIAIHSDIKSMLAKGKGRITILMFLINKYPNTNLRKHFKQWIDYHIERKDFEISDKDDRETR